MNRTSRTESYDPYLLKWKSILNASIPLVCILTILVSCRYSDPSAFEDNFESYKQGEFDNDVWKTDGNGIVRIDTTRSFSGQKSVHFVSGEGYSNRAFITLNKIFPMASGTYKGSMKMFVEQASPDGIHWTMIQSSGQVPGGQFRSEIRYGGQHNKQLMANYDTSDGVSSDCWHHSTTKIPEQEWFDVEWKFSTSKNEADFWLNGRHVYQLSVRGKGQGCVEDGTKGAWIFPIMENVSLGWVDYQAGGGQRNVWIDDVRITPIQ